MEKPVKTRRHPILSKPYPAAVLLMIWGIFFTSVLPMIPVEVITGNAESAAGYYTGAVLGILLMGIHKLWFRGEYRGSFRRGTSFRKPILLAAAAFLVVDILIWILDISRMGFCLISFEMVGAALMAGISEEAIYRVLIISTMMRALKDKKAYLPALAVSALLFGLIHLINAASAPISITILQIVGTIGTGILFGAMYLRTGSVILPMLIHVFHDVISGMIATQATGLSLFEATGWDYAETLVLCLAEVVIGIRLLRGRKDEIITVWQERWNTPAAD